MHSVDTEKMDRALTEFARLQHQNPFVVDQVVAFLMERNHTASVSLRFQNGKLQCAEFSRVCRAPEES